MFVKENLDRKGKKNLQKKMLFLCFQMKTDSIKYMLYLTEVDNPYEDKDNA